MTREAFENAITVVMAMGGSTNAVLHLLAITHEAAGRVEHRRLRRDKPPHAVHNRSAPRRSVRDVRTWTRSGGVPVVMKQLLDAGLLHGDALTITGKTIAENLDELDLPEPDSRVIHPVSAPRSPDRRTRHPEGQPRTGRRCHKGVRHEAHGARRAGARVQRRATRRSTQL